MVTHRVMAAQYQIWIPFGFAAVLAGMKLFVPGGAGDPAFFSFLPMCFFFVGATQMTLLKRIKALESAASNAGHVGA